MKQKRIFQILTFCVLMGSMFLSPNVVFGAPPAGDTYYDLRVADVGSAFTVFGLNGNNSTLTWSATMGVTVTGTTAHPPAIQIGGRDIDANLGATKKWLIVRMSSTAGPYAGFYFTTSTGETQYLTFPIVSDGQLRNYNVYLGNETIPNKPTKISKFVGHISLFAIIPSYENGAVCVVQTVQFTETPKTTTNGFFIPEYAGAHQSVYRVFRWGTIGIRVRNGGGVALTGITVTFSSPTIQLKSTFRDIPASLAPDQPATFYADVNPTTVGTNNTFTVTVTASNGQTITMPGYLNIVTALSPAPPQGTIPLPNPLDIPNYDIGMYYGGYWGSTESWPSIVPYTERKPELGYYDEGDPISANWTIKWAVEHGVEFMDVLLYTINGQIKYGEFLNEGLMQASFLSYIKFFVTLSNDKGFISRANVITFYQYVINNYFGTPSYKKSADGRYMLGMLSPVNMTVDLGAATVEGILVEIDTYAKTHGYPAGVYWVGGHKDNEAQGFEGYSYYSYPSGGNKYPSCNATYFVAGLGSYWGGLYDATCPTCITFLPTSTGFDRRPWDGKMEELGLRYNFTPALFKQNLEAAKAFIDPHIGQKTILIECWSEFGEGSALSPNGLYGFGLLDKIREVFAPTASHRVHVTPRDVGVYAPEIPGLWGIIPKPNF